MLCKALALFGVPVNPDTEVWAGLARFLALAVRAPHPTRGPPGEWVSATVTSRQEGDDKRGGNKPTESSGEK